MMNDKHYLSEAILQIVLNKLDELKIQPSQPQLINLALLHQLLEQAQQQSG